MKRRPFPCSNRLVEQRLEERHLQQHHAAMKKVKSTLDTRGPPLKRNMNLKKLQMEEGASVQSSRGACMCSAQRNGGSLQCATR